MQETKVIVTLLRQNNDANGNPRWKIIFSDGAVAFTHNSSDCVYGLDSAKYMNVPVEVSFTPHGRVWKVELPEKEK